MELYTPPEGALIIRQTHKGTYDRCGAIANYLNHPGYIESPSEPLTFGSVFHYGCHQVVKGASLLEVIDPSVLRAELVRILVTEYALPSIPDVYDVVEGLSEQRVESFIEEMQVALSQWYKAYWKEKQSQITVLIAEQTLFRPLGQTKEGRWIVLQGTPDAVYDIPKLVDWKTAARGWKFEKAQFTDQFPLYASLVEYNYGLLPLEAEFVVYNRQNGLIEVHETSREQIHVEVAVRNTFLRGLQLASGDPLPATPVVTEYFKEKRGWYCGPKYCPAWNCCEFKWLNDKVDETVERKLSW